MAVGALFHLDQHDRADVVQRAIGHTETHYVLGHQTTLNATGRAGRSQTCVICHDLSEHQPCGQCKGTEKSRGRGTSLKYIE